MRVKKFTLIELLIVVAIIAILAAMLLPALGKARDKAKAIKCVGNLKQTGMLLVSYNNDHNGHLPFDGHFSYSHTADYLNDYYPRKDSNYGPGSIWNCDKLQATYAGGKAQSTTYSWNHRACKTEIPDYCNVAYRIHNPSHKILMMDSWWDSRGWFAYDETGYFSNLLALQEAHGKRRNILWADFHVEPYPSSHLMVGIGLSSWTDWHALWTLGGYKQ